MTAGILGGVLTTWVTFTPCFMWIFVGAPYVEALRKVKALNAALSAITAAVVGVVLNLAVWFALHTIFGEIRDLHLHGLILQTPVLSSLRVLPLILSVAAVLALFVFRLGMVWTLIGAVVAGFASFAFGLA